MTVKGRGTSSWTVGRKSASSSSSSPMSYRTGDDTRVPEDDLKKSNNEVWLEIQRLLLIQNLLTAVKRPHSFLSDFLIRF